MKTDFAKSIAGAELAQIAWVVKDIHASIKFFREAMHISFSDPEIMRLKDYNATFYGIPTDAETLVSMAYTSEIFIELIQPYSGTGLFQEYLHNNPGGGVQHVAYRISVADFETVISGLAEKGYPVIATFDTTIAKIVYLDTTKDIGVLTEIMGITEVGEKAIEEMKNQLS